jgi:hypothetical protein
MKIFKIIAFLFGLLFLVGGSCNSVDTTQSNKIEQSEIYQDYNVRENDGNYDVTAFFRIGGKTGTTLALSSPSKILFNGQPLKENLNTSNGTFYSISVPNATASGTFEFTDRKGKVYTNKISFAKISTLVKTIKPNGKTSVEIPLSRQLSDESGIHLLLSNGENTSTEFVGSVFDASLSPSKKSIIVKPVVFQKFKGGIVRVNLDVTDSNPTQEGTYLGGLMSFSYKTTPSNSATTVSDETKIAVNKAIKTATNSNIRTTANVKTGNVNTRITNINPTANTNIANVNSTANAANTRVKMNVKTSSK